MKCEICGKKTNRAVRITTRSTVIRFHCCPDCRELALQEVKRRSKKVIVNPTTMPELSRDDDSQD
jgi:hypothetical protein